MGGAGVRVIYNLFRPNIGNNICTLTLKLVSSFLNKNTQTHTETLSVKDSFPPGSHVFLQAILELGA